MKILLYGRTAKNIEELVKNLGFEIVNANPEVVISYGGDGTLLSTERRFPHIPKLPIRSSQLYNKCPKHTNEVMLKKLLDVKLHLREYKKLVTTILYKNFYALNDFVIRNSDTTHSIRFKTSATVDQVLIGDGVVISTPLGSTAYFKSITAKSFTSGFGLAFNNTTKKIPPALFKDQDQITVNLIRGKATLSFDNSPDIFVIDENSELTFSLSDQTAQIYDAETLRCPDCRLKKV
ncbi:NAD(+)/NADH kinase [Candidatus Daviesbacteria bacterium]|nr:NAD(+)/NADH kinase [Candidatus Daviesbacteria bacterium]